MTTRTTSSQGSHGSSTSRAQDTRLASQSSSRDDQSSSHGKQGFASMPKEKVQEIAREGGKHSHDNDPDRNRK